MDVQKRPLNSIIIENVYHIVLDDHRIKVCEMAEF